MKTILITGSTDGIGKLAAIQFALDGHHVFVHGRNPDKLKLVIEEIKQKTKNPNIDGFIADFSDLNAVRLMANEVEDKLSKLDVLINNAGVFKSPIEKVNLLDIRFIVNYLAPYILTNTLIKLLKKSNSPRVINLSSAAQAPVSLEALKGEESISVNQAYAQSKLALTMWSKYLAKNHKEIVVIPINPGSLLNTNMVKEAYGEHWSSADKGSNMLYELAVLPELISHSGEYFDNDKGDPKGVFSEAHPDAYDEQLIGKLMLVTDEIIK